MSIGDILKIKKNCYEVENAAKLSFNNVHLLRTSSLKKKWVLFTY